MKFSVKMSNIWKPYVLIFFSTISRIIIFGCRWVNWTLSTLAILTCIAILKIKLNWFTSIYLFQFKLNYYGITIDCDPDLECICVDGPVPIVPVCPGVAVPFWWGNVWKFIALVGSISSRKPSKWNVAYGQISSSMPVFFFFSQKKNEKKENSITNNC